MHNCKEFRERITEHIIDREDVAATAEFRRELLLCSSCSEFCVQSREMMDALSEINLSISETQWQGIERRLRHAIVQAEPEQMERTFASSILTFGNWGRRAAVSFLAAAALLLISITFFRFSEPVGPSHGRFSCRIREIVTERDEDVAERRGRSCRREASRE
jgi:hypothetical protein